MKTTILILLVMILALQIKKMIVTQKLNKMLRLKQSQLRSYNAKVIIKENNRLPQIEFVFTVILIVITIIVPIGNSNNDIVMFSEDASNETLMMGSNRSTILYDIPEIVYEENAILSAVPNSVDLQLLSNTVSSKVDGSIIYTLKKNYLYINEVSNSSIALLKELQITEYIPKEVYIADDYFVIAGDTRKPEFFDVDLRDQLDYTYDTIIEVYSIDTFKKINEYRFDGYFKELVITGNKISLVTENKLFRDLILKDMALASYSSASKSDVLQYKNMITDDNISNDKILNIYDYNIDLDTVNIGSFIVDEYSGVKINENNYYVYTRTEDNKTIIYKYLANEEISKFMCEGQIYSNEYMYFYKGYDYFVSSLADSVIISKVYDSTMRINKSYEFSRSSNISDLEFRADEFSFSYFDNGQEKSVLFDIYNMDVIDSDYNIKENLNFELTNGMNFSINETLYGYDVIIQELINGSYTDLSTYKFYGTKFENFELEGARYYPSQKLILVNTTSTRYAFTNMLTAFSIDDTGVSSIVYLKSGVLNMNDFEDCIIKNNYIYVINDDFIKYYSLIDSEIYGEIDIA